MKTKLIILAAAAAAILYSCSNDRDEDVRNDTVEGVKKTKTKENFKLNKSGLQSREVEPEAVSDTVRIRGANGNLGSNPDTNLDPKDGNEVVDPTKPDKPW